MTRWNDGVSLFVNATPDDGIDHYDLWHNGGPGGPMFMAQSREAAEAICAAVNELLELRAEIERLRENADARERFHRREHDLLRAAEREIERLRAENGKLRDVLEWSEAQCPGKCAGVCGDALTYAAERGAHNQGEKE